MDNYLDHLEAGLAGKQANPEPRSLHEASIPETLVVANGEEALGVPKSRWGFMGSLKGNSTGDGEAVNRESRKMWRKRSGGARSDTGSEDGVKRIKQAPAKHAPTLGTLNGVLIPTCEVRTDGLQQTNFHTTLQETTKG